MKTIISPSILSCDFANIETELERLNQLSDIWIHLDIMDGHFVPNLTFGAPIVKRITELTDHILDAHLMVTNPEFHLELMKDYGLTNITFHLETQQNSLELITKAKKHYPKVGLSIKPGTSETELVDELLKAVDLVLVMSVEPGFGGQSFMENSLSKISNLVQRRRALGTDFIIQVDGGINNSSFQKVIDAGADNLVAGSYIFSEPSKNYEARVNSLRVK